MIVCEGDLEEMAAIECLARNDVCLIDSIGYQRASFDLMENFTTQVFLEEVTIEVGIKYKH